MDWSPACRWLVATLTTAALLPLAGCRDDDATGQPAATASSTAPPVPDEYLDYTARTTSPEIAIGNLDARVSGAQTALKSHPKDQRMRARAVDAHLQRFQYLATVEDLDAALEIGRVGTELHPEDPSSYTVHSRALSAAHRFSEAEKALDKAEELYKRGPLELERAGLDMARGDFAKALTFYKARREKAPNTINLAREAIVLGHLGRTDEAHEAFKKAIAAYRDVSPFMVAWVFNSWAAMWEDHGDLKRAQQLYRLALKRLPSYAHAATHLAQLVPPSEGLKLLEPVTKRATDPDVIATVASLKATVQPGSADAEQKRATTGFSELLDKHELAYADHAAWFFLGAGKDPERATALAQKNVENRKTPDAFALLLAATRAKGGDPHCQAFVDARALGTPNAALTAEIAKSEASCKNTKLSPTPASTEGAGGAADTDESPSAVGSAATGTAAPSPSASATP